VIKGKSYKTLELFAGSRSFSKIAKEYGYETYCTDIEEYEGIDQACNIFDFDVEKMKSDYGTPKIIWASPPCTYFSVASIGYHWNVDNTPKTEQAIHGVAIVERTLEIITELNPVYYFIENPRGKLRKLPVVENLPYRKTVTYCSYGDSRMKPTDLWTNYDFNTRDMCFNGNKDCHHEPAPRGSKTGTQGLDNAYLRSMIPAELFEDIFEQIIEDENSA
tara:strand:- start:32 stop:688 length:657 start_codon:yes stop_codon:yes gene_type:complete